MAKRLSPLRGEDKGVVPHIQDLHCTIHFLNIIHVSGSARCSHGFRLKTVSFELFVRVSNRPEDVSVWAEMDLSATLLAFIEGSGNCKDLLGG